MAFATSLHKGSSLPGVFAGMGPKLPARVRLTRVARAASDAKEGDKRRAFGYVESDSAGQENIFAVQPTQYVEGSGSDVNADKEANTTIAIAGAVLGLTAVGLGVVALISLGDGAPSDEGGAQYQPLSQYSKKFAAELEAPDI